MQIENEHEQQMEKLRLESQSHKRNVIFATIAMIILGTVITSAIYLGQGELAKDFLYIILTAIGGAGMTQFFSKK